VSFAATAGPSFGSLTTDKLRWHSYKASGWWPLLLAWPTFTLPAAEHHCLLVKCWTNKTKKQPDKKF